MSRGPDTVAGSEANREPPLPPGIVRPPTERVPEAIEALLRGDRGAARRFLSFASQSGLRLDGLWSRTGGDGRFVETVLAAASPGRTATLFASAVRRSSEVAGVAELIETACRGLPALGVALGQALVDPRDALQLEAFTRAGLRRLASLAYLERALPGSGALRIVASDPAQPIAPEVRAERWDPAKRAELVSLLEQTYVDTLDCPDLAGLRRGEDILEGHLHSGRFEPEHWTILRSCAASDAGRALGVCLLNSTPPATGLGAAAGSIELVYLGLIPAARGRGLGSALLHFALGQLVGRPERSVVLAVDERNLPALALYRAAGFRASIRRVAFIHPVRRRSNT